MSDLKFTVLGKEYEISTQRQNYMTIFRKCLELSDGIAEEFEEMYRNNTPGWKNFEDDCPDIAASVISERVDEILAFYTSNKIYDVTKQSVLDTIVWNAFYKSAYNDVLAEIEEINENAEAARARRQAAKDGRARWSGGGFGFSGAVKGAAAAGAMNMASGMAYGTVNAIGNAGTAIARAIRLDSLMSRSSAISEMAEGLEQDVFFYYLYMGKVLEEHGVCRIDWLDESDKANSICDNLDNASISEEQRREMISQILNLGPQCGKCCKYIFAHYDIPEKKNIVQWADYFCVNLKTEIDDYLRKRVDLSLPDSLQTAQDTRAKLLGEMEQIGVESCAAMTEADSIVYKYRLEKEYKDIKSCTTTEQLENITNALDRDYYSSDDLEDILEAISDATDVLCTYFDIRFPTQKEALEQKAIHEGFLAEIPACASSAEVKALKDRINSSTLHEKIRTSMDNAVADALFNTEEKEYRALLGGSVYSLNAERLASVKMEMAQRHVCERLQKICDLEIYSAEQRIRCESIVRDFNNFFDANAMVPDIKSQNWLVKTVDKLFENCTEEARNNVMAGICERYSADMRSQIVNDCISSSSAYIGGLLPEMPGVLIYAGSPEFTALSGTQDFVDAVKPWEIPVAAVASKGNCAALFTTDAVHMESKYAEYASGLDFHNKSILVKNYLEVCCGENKMKADLHNNKKIGLALADAVVRLTNDLGSKCADLYSITADDTAADFYHEYGRSDDFGSDLYKIFDMISAANASSLPRCVKALYSIHAAEIIRNKIDAFTLEDIEPVKAYLKERAVEIPEVDAVIRDVEMRYIDSNLTFNGRVFDSVPERELAERRWADICSCSSKANENDAGSIFLALDGIAALGYPYEDHKPCTQKLIGRLKNIIDRSDSIPELSGYNDSAELLSRKLNDPDTEELLKFISEKIRQTDIDHRTYNGVLYDTEETKKFAERTDNELLAAYSEAGYDPEKMISAAGKICSDGYYTGIQENYASQIAQNILNEINTINSAARLKALNDLVMTMDSLERFDSTRQMVQALGEKYAAADIAERTYKGVLFDRPEDIPAAKSSEADMELILRSVQRENEESVRAAIGRINEFPTKLKEYYLGILNGYLAECEVAKRTFKGVVYDTIDIRNEAEAEFQRCRDELRSLDRTDENAVRSAYEKLRQNKYTSSDDLKADLESLISSLDLQYRTVDGVILNTREEADLARSELSSINLLMQNIDQNNEPGMLDVRLALSAMKTPVRDKYLSIVGKMLDDYDVRCRTFRNKVYSTREEVALLNKEEAEIERYVSRIDPENEQTMLDARNALEAMQTFLKDGELPKINKMLKDFDIRARTFNKKLYDTREQAAVARDEFAEITRIMESLSPDDEQSLLSAQIRIGQMQSDFKAGYLKKVNDMWNAYDLKMRTYQKIVFDTRTQAENARLTREEFLNMVDTMDLSQMTSVFALENYIQDKLNERIRPEAQNIVNDIKDVIQCMEKAISDDRQINPATDKKASAELFKLAEKTIPRMEKYHIDTTVIKGIKDRHYGSLNAGQKLFSFFKSKL